MGFLRTKNRPDTGWMGLPEPGHTPKGKETAPGFETCTPPITAVPSTGAQGWNQPVSWSASEHVKKVLWRYVMGYHSAVKNKTVI